MRQRKKKTYWTRLLQLVRQEWSRSNPERKECFMKARVPKTDAEMQKWHCTHCHYMFALSEIECDHIFPIGNTRPQTREEYQAAFDLLHSRDLQVLCKSCHKIKTKEDLHRIAYQKKVENVSLYTKLTTTFIYQNLTFDKINDLDKVVKKLQDPKISEKQKISYFKKLNKLMEKYL